MTSLASTNVSINGLLQSESTLSVAAPTRYLYDSLSRIVQTISPLGFTASQTYDGNGHITQVDHVVIDGTPPPEAWRPATGTYSVNADCTGKATITFPSSPQPPLVVYFVIVNQGKQIRQVVEGNAVIATGRRVK